MNQPYPYRPGVPLSREQSQIMAIRFSPDWTLVEIAQAVRKMGGRLANDNRGGLVVVRSEQSCK